MDRKKACLAVLCAIMLCLSGCSSAGVDATDIQSTVQTNNLVSTTITTEADSPLDEYINFDSHVTFDVEVRNADQNLPSEIPSLPEKKEIETKFDAATGTLTVSVSRQLVELYPRKITYIANKDTKLSVIKVDKKVKHLVISEGVTGIYNSFNDMHALESVSFPSSLRTIQDSFINCDRLTKVVFPEKLELLRNAAFLDCDGITSLEFNSPVIMDNPRAEICHMDDACIDCSLEIYGVGATPFNNLNALEEVYIPGGSALYSSFLNCKNLRKATLGIDGGPVLINGNPFRGSHKDFCVYTQAYCFISMLDDPISEKRYFIQDWAMEWKHNRYDDKRYTRIHYLKTVPDILKSTVTTEAVQLTWEQAEDSERYYIYRQIKGEETWTLIGVTTKLSYVDTTVKSGVSYRYALKAPEFRAVKWKESDERINPTQINEEDGDICVLYDERIQSNIVVSAYCDVK